MLWLGELIIAFVIPCMLITIEYLNIMKKVVLRHGLDEREGGRGLVCLLLRNIRKSDTKSDKTVDRRNVSVIHYHDVHIITRYYLTSSIQCTYLDFP